MQNQFSQSATNAKAVKVLKEFFTHAQEIHCEDDHKALLWTLAQTKGLTQDVVVYFPVGEIPKTLDEDGQIVGTGSDYVTRIQSSLHDIRSSTGSTVSISEFLEQHDIKNLNFIFGSFPYNKPDEIGNNLNWYFYKQDGRSSKPANTTPPLILKADWNAIRAIKLPENYGQGFPKAIGALREPHYPGKAAWPPNPLKPSGF